MFKSQCILVLLLANFTITQSQDKDRALSIYFETVRKYKDQPIPQHIFYAGNIKNTLLEVMLYLEDTSVVVRSKAYGVVRTVGVSGLNVSTRGEATSKLVMGIRDKDSGNVGLVLDYLTDFSSSDFSQVAKDTLVVIFKRRSAHYERLIRLIGYVQLTQLRDDLRALSQSPTEPKSNRWAALLALARMGDSYAIESIMSRVPRLPVNDDVVYQIFPDLVYTRQRPAFDLLLKALNSDEKNCESANAESAAKIPCAYRVMEMLAPAVASYPLKLDDTGDIDAKNYPEALQLVRDWFKANKDYTIITDKY